MKNIIIIIVLLIALFQSLRAQSGNQISGTNSGQNISTGSYNTLFGDSTGVNITTQDGNVLMGTSAGNQNLTDFLVAIGYFSGAGNSTGVNNTFVGPETGRGGFSFSNPVGNLVGGENVAIGAESAEFLTTGANNTFVGEESGTRTTTGYENTFIGEDAGQFITSGYRQVFIGSAAGNSAIEGYANVAIGREASYDTEFGHHNTALGDSSLTDNGSGLYNVILGQGAGPAIEHADYNTFIGREAGWDNNRLSNTTNANRNTYAGASTGYSNRDGQDNVGIGAYSNFDNRNRSRCTFIGADLTPSISDVLSVGYKNFADGQYGIGIGNVQGQRDGAGSIALGQGVRMRFTNVAYTIAIGYLADFDEVGLSKNKSIGIGNEVSVSSLEAVMIGADGVMSGDKSVAIGDNSVLSGKNSVAIGSQILLKSNHEAFFGNATTTTIGSTLNWTATSDGRFKENIREDVPGLEFIKLLRPVSYHFDLEKLTATIGGDINDGKEKKSTVYSGFIAQEVKDASDQLNYDFSGVKIPADINNGSYGIRYASFVIPLTKAIQELNVISLHQKDNLSNSLQLISEQRERIRGMADEMVLFEQQLLLLQNELLEKTKDHAKSLPCTDCAELLTSLIR